MRKALFFDIDGTLVNFQGQMPESAKRALLQAQSNGHLIVLCSGRSVGQVYPFLLEMGFDGIIAAAGAYVEYKKEVIVRHRMDKKTVDAICDLLEEANAIYSAQAESRVFISGECKRRMKERNRLLGRSKELTEYVDKHMEVTDCLKRHTDIEKFNFFNSQITVAGIRERLAGLCDVTAMSFDIPTDTDGEICTKGIHKAFGIQKFIERAKIAKEDTVAFGDGPNDADMLSYAHTGVAMGNARKEIKACADFVTHDIDEDGIAHALSALGLV